MNIQLIVQDSASGKIHDISELVDDISWDTELEGQPGKLTFDYIHDASVVISEGSPLTFKVNGTGVFYGFVFKRSITDQNKITVTAYDQLRYLKNKDTYVISDMTASQIFEKLCKDFQLPYRVVNASSYVVGKRVFDNKTGFEIIQTGIDETLAYTAQWYMIRDNFGTLEFRNLSGLKTNLFIGDESLMNTFEYSSSIDDDTYNQIKLIKENSETGKRELYVVRDSATIKTWGLLQYFEKMDEEANTAQISQRAETLLSLKNRVTKTLKASCLGDLRVFAGAGVVLGISDLASEGLAQPKYFMVNKCTHKFKNTEHTMDLELQVSV